MKNLTNLYRISINDIYQREPPNMADQKINWKNTLFLIITPLIGIGGTLILASLGLIHGKPGRSAASTLLPPASRSQQATIA